MVKIWGFLPVRNENVPHISTESLPRNVQNNTGKNNTFYLLHEKLTARVRNLQYMYFKKIWIGKNYFFQK